ncbi:hypothetical protein CPB85DRAFT_1287348 [Mucidula mucida]|nr:hypothetical protein CPB85DRAFT_1287348 [Mucidula mucida]
MQNDRTRPVYLMPLEIKLKILNDFVGPEHDIPKVERLRDRENGNFYLPAFLWKDLIPFIREKEFGYISLDWSETKATAALQNLLDLPSELLSLTRRLFINDSGPYAKEIIRRTSSSPSINESSLLPMLLSKMTNLQSLDICQFNFIGLHDHDAFERSLTSLTSLHHLRLAFVAIQGTRLLFMLSKMSALKVLDIHVYSVDINPDKPFPTFTPPGTMTPEFVGTRWLSAIKVPRPTLHLDSLVLDMVRESGLCLTDLMGHSTTSPLQSVHRMTLRVGRPYDESLAARVNNIVERTASSLQILWIEEAMDNEEYDEFALMSLHGVDIDVSRVPNLCLPLAISGKKDMNSRLTLTILRRLAKAPNRVLKELGFALSVTDFHENEFSSLSKSVVTNHIPHAVFRELDDVLFFMIEVMQESWLTFGKTSFLIIFPERSTCILSKVRAVELRRLLWINVSVLTVESNGVHVMIAVDNSNLR